MIYSNPPDIVSFPGDNISAEGRKYFFAKTMMDMAKENLIAALR